MEVSERSEADLVDSRILKFGGSPSLFFERLLVGAHGFFGVDFGVAEAVFVGVGEGVEHADEVAGDFELSGVASFLWGYCYGCSVEVEVLPSKRPCLSRSHPCLFEEL